MKGHACRIAVILGVFVHSALALNILSFNIRQYGLAKYAKQDVVNVLVDIIEDYDLIFVIELVDPTDVVLPGFVRQLNRSVEGQGFMFDYVVSERVGRTNYKEQYAVIYRTNVVQILNTFQYVDTYDIFQRPPFSIYIQTIDKQSGDLPPFFLIVIHTQPTDTASEIDGLLDVYDAAASYFSTSAGMLLGDMNADCSYLSNTRYYNLELFLNTSFTWWIDKTADTTSGASDCAYDRIITSSRLTPYVVNGSVGIIEFDKKYDLTQEFTAKVSDHYPVNITLRGPSTADSSCVITRGLTMLWIMNMIIACGMSKILL